MTGDEQALFLAIQANDGAQLRELVRASPALLRAVSPLGVSPVLFATYYGRHDMARALVALGADLDVFEAAAMGDAARVRELTDGDPSLVNAVSGDGFTPLGLAAFFGREEVAAALLERGADVNAVSANAMRAQPLHSAVAGNHAALARTLLDHGAHVNAAQHGGWTPLMGAAQHGNTALVAELLSCGAHAGAATTDGRTAADLAREEGHAATAALLPDGT